MPLHWSKFPQEVRIFIRDNSFGCNRNQMAELLDEKFPEFAPFDPLQIAAFRRHRGIKSYAGSSRLPFTLYEFVKSVAKGRTHVQIYEKVVEKYGEIMSLNQLHHFMNNHRITTGLTGRFEKGHKRNGPWVAPTGEAAERWRAHQYKPGNRPANWKPVGTKVTTREGFVRVKVKETGTQNERWPSAARVEWEKAHGPIPEGFYVAYIDGDRNNTALDNLRLLPVKDHVIFNNLPATKTAEQLETKLALVELTKARRKAMKRLQGGKA